MPYQPMNLGNVLSQGENILNARYSRDPNSLPNQLIAARLNALNAPSTDLNFGTVNPRDWTAKSMAIYEKTGDRNDLVRYEPPRTAIKVDEGDSWGFYHPLTSELIQKVPKNLGPTQTEDYIENAAAAGEQGKQNVRLEMEPQVTEATERAKNRTAVEGKYSLEDADSVIRAQNKLGVMMTQDQKLDKVIQLSQNGANTGPLMRYLPTLTAETAELEQLQNEMGLDVISSVTFGALSKGELDLSLVTAVPTNLSGPDLVKWAKAKQAANKKLAGYLMEQIKFIRAGGTQAQWLEKVQNQGGINATSESYEERRARLLGQ